MQNYAPQIQSQYVQRQPQYVQQPQQQQYVNPPGQLYSQPQQQQYYAPAPTPVSYVTQEQLQDLLQNKIRVTFGESQSVPIQKKPRVVKPKPEPKDEKERAEMQAKEEAMLLKRAENMEKLKALRDAKNQEKYQEAERGIEKPGYKIVSGVSKCGNDVKIVKTYRKIKE